MERKGHSRGALVGIGFAILLLGAAHPPIAGATPVAHIAMSTSQPAVGQAVTFDGSTSICDNPGGCSYRWQWYWRSADGTTTHLGGQMGLTPVVNYAFDSFAASKPYVIVTLTVGAGRLIKPSTAQVSFVVASTTAGVEPPSTGPRLTISSAPNPFHQATTIQYGLPASGRVSVTILDVRGRLVRRLVTADEAAGAHAVRWDGSTDRGDRVKAGVYFARVETPSGVAARRLTITE